MTAGSIYDAVRSSKQELIRPDSNADALSNAARITGNPYTRFVLNTRDLDLSLPIELEELEKGSVFPPERMQPRYQRLELLRSVYEGDFHRVMDLNELADAGITPTNIARRIVAVQSNLMMRIPPTGMGKGLSGAAHRALHDIAIHGSCFVECAGSGGALTWRNVDARRVWWTVDGDWVTVEPRLTGGRLRHTNQADSVMVTVHRDGMAVRWMQAIAPYDITLEGRMLLTGDPMDFQELGACSFGAAHRQPEIEQGGFGTSMLLDLITLLAQHAVARARDSSVVDQHARPTLVLRGSILPYQGSGAGAQSLVAQRSGAGKHPREILEEQQLMSRLMRGGVLNFADASQYAEYLTWAGNLNASIQLQERIDMDLRLMSGVTALLGDNVELPSGMSLKRMFSVADAEAQSLRLPLLEALRECDETVEWDDAFAEVDDMNREDVESEATARRGTMELEGGM